MKLKPMPFIMLVTLIVSMLSACTSQADTAGGALPKQMIIRIDEAEGQEGMARQSGQITFEIDAPGDVSEEQEAQVTFIINESPPDRMERWRVYNERRINEKRWDVLVKSNKSEKQE